MSKLPPARDPVLFDTPLEECKQVIYTSSKGYKRVYVTIYTPKGPRVEMLARIVMAQKLGRPLLLGEIVHHEDENTLNNDPSNLVLMNSQSAHITLHRKVRRSKTRGPL